MPNHKVAVYWAPAHDQRPTLDYIRRLQPNVIRIMTEDVQHISDAHAAAPDAIIIPRIWRIDDDNGRAVREMNENPTEAGKRHAEQMMDAVANMSDQARERGIPFPHFNQIMLGGANEPNAGATYPVICDYALGFAYRVNFSDFRGALLCILGVGHPATPPPVQASWNDFKRLAALNNARPYKDHWIETHGYWQKEGPHHGEDYEWLAGRHHKCPLPFKHFIGECGIDGGIYDRNPKYGWQDYHLSPEQYSAQCEANHDALADNVVGMAIFENDYQSREWKGFDVTRANDLIVRWARTKDVTDSGASLPPAPPTPPTDNNVFLPIIGTGGDVVLDGAFKSAIDFVLQWEGGYVDHPDDPGGETNFGISKRAHPDVDIAALTRADAVEIYRREYWMPVASTLSHPLSLVYFDTAVLHGPGAASKWFGEYGGEFNEEWNLIYGMMLERSLVYLRSKNRERFAGGWTNRLTDLMNEIKKDV